MFLITIKFACAKFLSLFRYQEAHDDYNVIMVKALADRLAEVCMFNFTPFLNVTFSYRRMQRRSMKLSEKHSGVTVRMKYCLLLNYTVLDIRYIKLYVYVKF